MSGIIKRASAGIGDAHRNFPRLALISNRDHFENIEAANETLFVTSDWLLLEELRNIQVSVVHLQTEDVKATFPISSDDIFVRANDWMYDPEHTDLTTFRGISLGQCFAREVANNHLEIIKLHGYISAHIQRWNPKVIDYFDVRIESATLDDDVRFKITRSIARSFGVEFIDKQPGFKSGAAPKPYEGSDKVAGFFGVSHQSLSRRVFFGCLSAASQAITFGKKSKRLLLLCTHMNTRPILQAENRRGIKPALLVDHVPMKKNIVWLGQILLSGTRIYTRPRIPQLDIEDINKIEKIEANLRRNIKSSRFASASDIDLWVEIERIVLQSGGLYDAARAVLWANEFMDRCDPDFILTDSFNDPQSKILLHIAKKRGITTAATFHGLYTVDTKFPVLGSDPRSYSLIDVFLSWGDAGLTWLKRIGARTAPTVAGSLMGGTPKPYKKPDLDNKKTRILILQYSVMYLELEICQAEQFYFFVTVLSDLQKLGYRNLVFRIHPGTVKQEYYQEVANRFGIKCEISCAEPFGDILSSAEIVIGPAFSGALLEAIAAGKPYLPVMMKPSIVQEAYFQDVKLYETPKEIINAISQHSFDPPESLLRHFCSTRSALTPVDIAMDTIDQFAKSASLNHAK